MNTFKTIVLLAGFTCLFAITHGQTKQRLAAKGDSLKAMLLRADTLRPFNDDTVENILDTISTVNEEIAKKLTEILTNKATLAINLDSLLKLRGLGKVHSKDKRLWIFNWYENTGGSWKSNISLVHYRTQLRKPKIGYEASFSDEGQTEQTAKPNEFCSNGAWFENIYKLKARGRNLYLCIGSGISCNTCIYDIATVIELTKDSINFNYPAFRFKGRDDRSPASDNEACFTLDARMGDIEKFGFNPKTQTLTFVYFTDDNTPLQSVKRKRVVRRLVFDGVRFTGRGYK